MLFYIYILKDNSCYFWSITLSTSNNVEHVTAALKIYGLYHLDQWALKHMIYDNNELDSRKTNKTGL